MFSLHETSVVPAAFKARLIATSSALLRASRSTLWTIASSTWFSRT